MDKEMYTFLKELFQQHKSRKVFEDVFDNATIQVLHSLSSKGVFDSLEHVVSTGKEAHVFRARDKAGNPRAVKIYKILTSDFKHMDQYLRGDIRFKNIKHTKREIVFAWAKKEYKNLERARRAEVTVPMVHAFKDNVLVMEFIGEEKNAPRLKEVHLPEDERESVKEQWMDNLAKLSYRAGLVHADLSEYNVLYWKKKVYFIDIGQGVLLDHPKVKEFLDRDLKNTSNYFKKLGLPMSPEEILEDLRKRKKTLAQL